MLEIASLLVPKAGATRRYSVVVLVLDFTVKRTEAELPPETVLDWRSDHEAPVRLWSFTV